MRKAIAIDFDGCLCEWAWPEIGKPNMEVINAARQEKQNGTALILWTCRVGEKLGEAVAWCKGWGLEFDAVNANLPERIAEYQNDCRKVNADEYWDDRAVRMGTGEQKTEAAGVSAENSPREGRYGRMNGDIVRAIYEGVQVSLTPDCYPARGTVEGIRVSVTARTWNGMRTFNRRIGICDVENAEQMEEEIAATVKEMAEGIDKPGFWKG